MTRRRTTAPAQHVAVCLLALAVPEFLAASTITITDLSLAGQTRSVASYINNEGDIAGVAFFAGNISHDSCTATPRNPYWISGLLAETSASPRD